MKLSELFNTIKSKQKQSGIIFPLRLENLPKCEVRSEYIEFDFRTNYSGGADSRPTKTHSYKLDPATLKYVVENLDDTLVAAYVDDVPDYIIGTPELWSEYGTRFVGKTQPWQMRANILRKCNIDLRELHEFPFHASLTKENVFSKTGIHFIDNRDVISSYNYLLSIYECHDYLYIDPRESDLFAFADTEEQAIFVFVNPACLRFYRYLVAPTAWYCVLFHRMALAWAGSLVNGLPITIARELLEQAESCFHPKKSKDEERYYDFYLNLVKDRRFIPAPKCSVVRQNSGEDIAVYAKKNHASALRNLSYFAEMFSDLKLKLSIRREQLIDKHLEYAERYPSNEEKHIGYSSFKNGIVDLFGEIPFIPGYNLDTNEDGEIISGFSNIRKTGIPERAYSFPDGIELTEEERKHLRDEINNHDNEMLDFFRFTRGNESGPVLTEVDSESDITPACEENAIETKKGTKDGTPSNENTVRDRLQETIKSFPLPAIYQTDASWITIKDLVNAMCPNSSEDDKVTYRSRRSDYRKPSMGGKNFQSFGCDRDGWIWVRWNSSNKYDQKILYLRNTVKGLADQGSE